MFNKTNKVKIRLLPVFIFVAVLTVSVKLNNIFDLYNNPAQKTLSISPAQALAEENQEVKQKYTQATRQISNLSQEKKNLNEKVTLASQLATRPLPTLRPELLRPRLLSRKFLFCRNWQNVVKLSTSAPKKSTKEQFS